MKLFVRAFHYTLAMFLFLTVSSGSFGQSPSGYITDWKNDAQGAYTIIHDDYGDFGVDGIWQYADTICHNRGIKFTFGAIASSCETQRNVNGYGSPYLYAKEVMVAQHGHEIINHSHTHNCAVGNAGWSPCNAPLGQAWGESTSNPDFNTQLNTAHTSITTNMGFEPVYYIFPYDRFTQLANTRLKELGYIGSRTGWTSQLASDAPFYRNGYENSDEHDFYPDGDGFFRTAVQVFDDVDRAKIIADQVTELNSEVTEAINNNMWANRELHNVGTSGWGSVKVESYRQHIDFIQAKAADGSLWVGTVSEILTYQIQKLKYSPNVSYSAQNDEVTVSWNTINGQYNVNVADYLSPLQVKSPVTVYVDLDGLSGTWVVNQNNQTVNDYTQTGDKLYINVYPHEGNLTIRRAGDLPNQAPTVQNPINNFSNLTVNFTPFIIDLKEVFEDLETSDENLEFDVTQDANILVSLDGNGLATISSAANFTGNVELTFSATDEGALSASQEVSFTVQDLFEGHTPFNAIPIPIPGTVEVENYDIGAAGVVYNEVITNYEPDPSTNPYRANHPVDISEYSPSNYSIAYTEDGEWLEYTVDVAEDGFYSARFTIAQENQGDPVGQLRLWIDGEEFIPTTDMLFTGAWSTFETVNANELGYLTSGGHILRLEFVRGSVDVDKLEITKDISPIFDQKKPTSGLLVYPNPSKGQVFIEGEFESLTLFDAYGAPLITTTERILSLHDFPSGVYMLSFDHGLHRERLVILE